MKLQPIGGRTFQNINQKGRRGHVTPSSNQRAAEVRALPLQLEQNLVQTSADMRPISGDTLRTWGLTNTGQSGGILYAGVQFVCKLVCDSYRLGDTG